MTSPTPLMPDPASTKLQSEQLRLYVPGLPDERDAGGAAPALVDTDGRVRAMVLALARPADWVALVKVWQGVQADLELPAPAIAVSGTDGYQLWFSLAVPVPAAQATVFLEALRARYLGEVRLERIGAMPTIDASSTPQIQHAAMVPALQAGGERWSAFVAPDLAPVFAEEPWLDTPPSPEGQAELLARLKSIPLVDFERALAQLRPAEIDSAATTEGAPTSDKQRTPSGGYRDPKRFLLDVMNDGSVALALRIEAAKALLPGDRPER